MNLRDSPQILTFRQAAERFCFLLESKPDDADKWVEDVLASLAMLYACGHTLPTVSLNEESSSFGDEVGVDNTEWERVYSLVQSTLGTQTTYWAYFDPSDPPHSLEEPIFGDLADDLADIYRDIKPGLRAWVVSNDAMLPSIVFDWKEPLFGSHWGVHAVSAIRALHPLAMLRGLS